MAKILMHSLPNGRESRRADKVRSRGRSPGSYAAQRPARGVVKGLIAEA